MQPFILIQKLTDFADWIFPTIDKYGEATEIQWYATGSPTVVSGAMAGTLNNTITLSWDTAGAYEVRAKVIGDGDLLYDSLYSDALHVVCGPSIYCGCGIYCGDGSYPGMMLE